MQISQIIKKVKKNDPQADNDLLALAYDFAKTAHEGQKRASGEDYIQHSLHTAFMLAQMKADLNTVIAGILHDVPEDTSRTLKDVEKNFGKDIAYLVKGITKLSNIKYRGIERYRENLKKMFLAMARDLRVILIKFCDRLHNLRTLEALPKEKQIRIAQETIEIYAPIAGLLGIWRLKWQMEDICFKYLHKEEYNKLEYKYEVEKKAEHNQYIQKIKNALDEKLQAENIQYTLESRFKHLYSIYQKMQTKNRKFDEIYDVFALRIITSSVTDCYRVLGIIHSLWRPKSERIKDYIAMPKPNGYKSLHTTVFGPENKATEFQIRTEEMHEEAIYGIAAHWHYKEKDDKNSLSEQPVWIKKILNIQKETENTKDFIQEIKYDVFKNYIFVFSPKGDVIELPEKATPVDFAYHIHTDIGNKAVNALVNNKITTLDYALKNGDMVEIIMDKNRKSPNKTWLNFVKTRKARTKIKQYANKSTFEKVKRMIKL